jgi:hypothetical protein
MESMHLKAMRPERLLPATLFSPEYDHRRRFALAFTESFQISARRHVETLKAQLVLKALPKCCVEQHLTMLTKAVELLLLCLLPAFLSLLPVARPSSLRAIRT